MLKPRMAVATAGAHKQIAALLAVALDIDRAYRQAPATLFTTQSAADGDAVLNKEISDYTADLSKLKPMAIPQSQELQLTTIRAALPSLISATQSIETSLDGNSVLAASDLNQAFQAEQSVLNAEMSLEAALGAS